MGYSDYRKSCLERKHGEIPDKPSSGKKKKSKEYLWLVVRKRKDGEKERFGLGERGRPFVKHEDAEVYKSKSEREWNRVEDRYVFEIIPYSKDQ